MIYTFLSARYANDEHTAAVAITVEASALVLSIEDNPDEWASLHDWGEPAAYEAPPAVFLDISDRQFFQQLAIDGEITEAEALAAVATGTVPAALAAVIAALPSPDQFAANMFLQGATTFERNHPMTVALAGLMGWDDEMLGALWTAAAQL